MVLKCFRGIYLAFIHLMHHYDLSLNGLKVFQTFHVSKNFDIVIFVARKIVSVRDILLWRKFPANWFHYMKRYFLAHESRFIEQKYNDESEIVKILSFSSNRLRWVPGIDIQNETIKPNRDHSCWDAWYYGDFFLDWHFWRFNTL